MSLYQETLAQLREAPRKWLVTGVAGFIGSNLLETLLRLDQVVVGLDNLSTGKQCNLDEVKSLVTAEQWSRFKFIRGDISILSDCRSACHEVDYILHQAALGSVPRSIEDPLRSHVSNVDGFLNILISAKDSRVKRLVYASSSSVYGDHPALPKTEGVIGKVLSPYAATKFINEVYANVFSRCYTVSTVGLRYFNVFGARQDPNGAYAAVIPKWFSSLLQGQQVFINGDGETSRDFCYIENVIQANIMAATSRAIPAGEARIYNVACGQRTTLLALYALIRDRVALHRPDVASQPPVHHPERGGDVRHSLADISAAGVDIGYSPSHSLEGGLQLATKWYVKNSLSDEAPH